MRKINELENRIETMEETQNALAVSVGAIIMLGAVTLPVIGLVKGVKAISRGVKNAKAKKAAKAAAAEEAAKEEAEEASHEF